MPAAPPSEAEQAALTELRALRPLPAEDDPGWDVPDKGCWRDAEQLMALATRSGENGWRHLAIAVFDYAADWDVYGAMLNLRHGPERAWSEDSAGMAAALEPLLRSQRPGTLIWTAAELATLGMATSVGPLALLCAHREPRVARAARHSLGSLADEHSAAGLALVADQRRRGRPVVEVAVQTGAVDPDWSDHGKSVTTTVDGRWLADTAQLVTATLVLTDPIELGPEQRATGWLLPAGETDDAGRGLVLDGWGSLSVTVTRV